jgi:hypothetical protein
MKPHEQLELEMAADNIARIKPMMLGLYPAIAQMTRVYFNELVKEGFTEAQALHIVATQGIMARLNG